MQQFILSSVKRVLLCLVLLIPFLVQAQSAVCWESADCGLNHQPVQFSSYNIDSTLLPLNISKTTYAKHYSHHFPGLITAIHDRLMLSDSSGNMSFIDGDTFSEAGFPAIPKNNVTLRDIKYKEKLDSLFACFHYQDGTDKTHHTAVSRLQISKNISGSNMKWIVLYDTNHKDIQPDNCVLDVTDSKVYFIIGSLKEGQSERPYAQDKENSLGKSFALDLNSGKTQLLATGHRMSLGILSRTNRQVWFTENGERGGDKLSFLESGQNYGWPLKISGARYFRFSKSIKNQKNESTPFTEAVYSWLPSIAPSALIELNNFHPEWDGDLLMGSLKAQSLYRIRLANNHIHSIEQIHIGQRIRGIQQMGKTIFLTTDEGSLVTVNVDERRLNSNTALPDMPGGSSLGLCVNCHSFSHPDVTSAFGPSLSGIFGRGIALHNFAYFSDSLKKKSGIWDESTLTSFLLDPQTFAPGTTMKIGVKLSIEEVSKIVDVLKNMK